MLETFTDKLGKPDMEKDLQKKCFLETRNIGVTKNNLTVFLLFYFMNSLTGWVNIYNVFFIEGNLKVSKANVDEVQQTNRIIGYIVQFPIVISIGVVYDIYGRRKPFLGAWALASLAIFIYPFNDN